MKEGRLVGVGEFLEWSGGVRVAVPSFVIVRWSFFSLTTNVVEYGEAFQQLSKLRARGFRPDASF